MEFTCPRCNEVFGYKFNLKTHLQRKNICEPKYSQEDPDIILSKLYNRKLNDKTYDCEFCNIKFNHASTKCKHKKICKLNPDNKPTITISKEEYEALKLSRSDVSNIASTSITTQQNAKTINNTNTNNTTNNIVVNNFGQEDISHLAKRLEYYWANKGLGLVEMSKDMYFDPQHPENHTLNIPNQRKKIIHIRENDKWIPKDSDDAIDEIIYKISKEIEEFIEEKENYLYKKFPNKVDKNNSWWENVGTSKFSEKEYKQIVLNLINMVLYNRHIIK